MTHIAICTPCQDTWDSVFAQNFVSCVLHTARTLEGAKITQHVVRGTDINAARGRIAEEAMAAGATHLMWFDADMSFPPDAITRLLVHDKGIVGANYSTRQRPAKPTGRAVDGTVLYTDHMSYGLEPCLGLGFGVLLVKADVFDRLPKPWFNGGPSADGRYIGEDYYFCYRAMAELGEVTWCDHDLSKMVGHVGRHVYSFEDALEDRVEVRLIRDGVLDDPGDNLPGSRYRSIVDLEAKHSPEELANLRASYGRHWRQREDEEEARVMKSVGRSDAA